MKIISKITLSLAVASSIFFAGCNNNAGPSSANVTKKTFSEESLGLRKTNLYVEAGDTAGEKTKYRKTAAGSSKKIARAFQDAPPMIPHDVEGMLPIKINNNQCISCHAPDVASSVGATPYPKSHMTDFRPKTGIAADGRITKDGTAVDNTSSDKLKYVSIKSTAGRLSGARFNCSQCHAPQGEGQLVENSFEPVYTSKDGASRSSWNGTKLMEGIDTTK